MFPLRREPIDLRSQADDCLNAPYERATASRRYTEKIAFPINEVSAAAPPA